MESAAVTFSSIKIGNLEILSVAQQQALWPRLFKFFAQSLKAGLTQSALRPPDNRGVRHMQGVLPARHVQAAQAAQRPLPELHKTVVP